MAYNLEGSVKKERRKTQRIKFHFKVRLKPAKKKNGWRDAEYNNLSGGGVGIYFNKPLKPDSKVKVIINANKKIKPFEMLCRVDWCEERERRKNRFRIGLKFLKIKNEGRFRDFLCEKILEISSNRKAQQGELYGKN